MVDNRSSPTSPSPDSPAPMTVTDVPDALRQVVASMAGPVALIDRQLNVQAWSTAWADLAGHASGRAARPDQPPGFFQLFAEQSAWRERLERGLQGENGRGTAALTRRTDHTERRVDWEMQPWRAGDKNAVAGVMLSLVDRSAQQQAEDRFQALADTVDEGVLLMGHSGIFQMCNARAEVILGRTAEDIIGSSVRDVRWRGLREDGTPLSNESFPFWVARYTGEAVRDFVMGIYPPDGPPRWIRVNAQPLRLESDDEPYAVLSSFADITEQKLSQEALRTSKDMLSSVLVSSLDGIMVFAAIRDEDDAIVDFEWRLANPRAGELVGQSAEDLRGQRLLDVLPGHQKEGLFEDYSEVVEGGEPMEREVHYEHEGLSAWFQIVAVKLSDGIAVTLRDITERKEATQAMAATNAELEQRNQTLREFAYIASHDLQEPLRKISAFADLMREDYSEEVDDMGKYYLERMQDAADRMSTLINDLLAYSRVTTQTEPYEPVDLNKVLDDVQSDLEIRLREVNGQVDAEPLPTIQADPTQIRQLLQNLIGNGLKFHRDGVPPVITIRATVEQDEMPDDGPAPLPMCRLVVEDNGIGIEEKYLDRIFTPFKRLYGRSQYEGTGMGLAICQRIAQRHGGSIAVASTPGEGTRFTVSLPVEQPANPEQGSPSGGAPPNPDA